MAPVAMARWVEHTATLVDADLVPPHSHSATMSFLESAQGLAATPGSASSLHPGVWHSSHARRTPTSFMLGALASLFGRDKKGTVQFTGIPRDPTRKWWSRHPGSAAGWAVLAYHSAESAKLAAEDAERAQESAEKLDMIARACADQAKAALAQAEITSRIPKHTKRTQMQKEACEHVRKQVEEEPSSADDFHVAKRLKECTDGEFIDFCDSVRAYIKASDLEVTQGRRREDKEMVQMRKFCGALEAMMDRETGVGAPEGTSALIKIGNEEGLTLYDNPPGAAEFELGTTSGSPLTDPPWVHTDRFSTPMNSYMMDARSLAALVLLPGFQSFPVRVQVDPGHVGGPEQKPGLLRWNQFL